MGRAASRSISERGVGRLVVFVEACADACGDAKRGYAMAAEHARDPELRAFFDARAAERGRFETTLHDEIERLGGDWARGRSVTALAHRGWMVARAAVGGDGRDKALVEECGRGEREAERLYVIARHAAARIGASPELRDVLEAQAIAVDGARDYLSALAYRLDRAHSTRPREGHTEAR